MPPLILGPRSGRDVLKLNDHAVERARTRPHALAARMTKFVGNFTGQVRIPHNLLSKDRDTAGDQSNAERCIDVGHAMPED